MTDDGDDGCDVDGGECWSHIHSLFFPLKGLLQGWRLGDNQNQERWCFHIHFLKCIDTFTHKNFYTEEILHIFFFVHKHFYTFFYTEKLLHR